jgi:hypothetical protein
MARKAWNKIIVYVPRDSPLGYPHLCVLELYPHQWYHSGSRLNVLQICVEPGDGG